MTGVSSGTMTATWLMIDRDRSSDMIHFRDRDMNRKVRDERGVKSVKFLGCELF